MSILKDSIETKKRILAVCVRLFLEQGYKQTSISQIIEETGIARGSFQNLFPTKDAVLLELVDPMLCGQFGTVRSNADDGLLPVCTYALETAIQLTFTEMNENLRELYTEIYSLPETAEYIYLHTTTGLKKIFGSYSPDYAESDFYEFGIGTSGMMRSYIARPCDTYFTLERKLERFLTAAMRMYKVPEEEQKQVLQYISSIDIRKSATETMKNLFAVLEKNFDFKMTGSESGT